MAEVSPAAASPPPAQHPAAETDTDASSSSDSEHSSADDSSDAEDAAVTDHQRARGLWSPSWARRGRSIRNCGIHRLMDRWTKHCAVFTFDTMLVCSYCGECSFPAAQWVQRWGVHRLAGPHAISPYSFSNALHGGITNTGRGEFFVCPACKDPAKRAQRMQYLVLHPPDYMRAVLCLDSALVMQLSLVRVGAGFMSHAYGFTTARVQSPSVVPAALLNWYPDAARRAAAAPAALREVLATNLLHNPLYQRFLAVIEQLDPAEELPYLTPEAVASIVGDVRERGPLFAEEQADAQRSVLSVVMPVVGPAVRGTHAAPTAYTAGTLQPREPGGPVALSVAADGAAVAASALAAPGLAISAEAAMFPFLFPDGVGMYSGGTMSLTDYLTMRSRQLLSMFTLCKPYLLLMYCVRQTSLLSKGDTPVSPYGGCCLVTADLSAGCDP